MSAPPQIAATRFLPPSATVTMMASYERSLVRNVQVRTIHAVERPRADVELSDIALEWLTSIAPRRFHRGSTLMLVVNIAITGGHPSHAFNAVHATSDLDGGVVGELLFALVQGTIAEALDTFSHAGGASAVLRSLDGTPLANAPTTDTPQ